ncbi:polysaccharide biosynthesis tyrosine autokinase [Actinomadura scrupuli]|uniref:polysaccharide biosynthesis tyrosine autokinase n=1 Tax=Actinomadura scrupuli TaxID=559629 RepID=UPI003D955CC9
MEITRYLRLLQRHWALIMACTVLAVVSAWIATTRATPQYAASITMFVSVADRSMDSTSAYQATLLSQERVKSYANLLNSYRLTDRLAEESGGLTSRQLQDRISAEVVPDTVLLRATVTDSSPARAKQIADALGTRFVALVDELERPAASKPARVKVTVVDNARLPTGAVSPSLPDNLAIGLIIGLVLGICGGLLRESLDLSVKTVEQLREITGSPVLGVICQDDSAAKHPLIVEGPAHGARAEAFRFLRTNVRSFDGDDPVRSVVVTSAVPHEGKSLTACNLAISFAQAGKRVILVDGDLRRHGLAKYLGIKSRAGLTSLLVGQASLEEALHPWDGMSLSVLSSGPMMSNPSELLGAQHMPRLLEELHSRADLVVIDAPSLLPVADAAILSKICDGAVLVTRYGRTSREQVRRAAEQLSAVDARLLGTVLNRVPHNAEPGYQHAGAYDLAGQPVETV